MSISVFDLFKVGVGPSSSHTVGPMLAANRFLALLQSVDGIANAATLEVDLYGSLSATGKGHGTHGAIVAGLRGHHPESVDPASLPLWLDEVMQSGRLMLADRQPVDLDWNKNFRLHEESLPFHPNGMRITALNDSGSILASEVYYSIGGGFVVNTEEAEGGNIVDDQTAIPFEFSSAAELLAMASSQQVTIAELMMANEKCWRDESAVRHQLLLIWEAMRDCVANGLIHQGILPGGLNVERRAKEFHAALSGPKGRNLISSSFAAMDWVNLYALAVNEENAGGGRGVTAPTNGAAGIIPAVLMYFVEFGESVTDDAIVDFLLTAAAVGILCKKNASLSGAEVGCQGEVGSACAMAAAGLCAVLGGTPEQVENAAEIGLEHNLGLTCDPVGGLVQVPCIERNALAAVKAINAALMALRGTGEHFISLDKVIKTMRDTGLDMQEKYKETAKGGLAVNAVEC